MTDQSEEYTPVLIPFEKATDDTLSENPADTTTQQKPSRLAKLDKKLTNGLSGAAGGVIQGADTALKGLSAIGNASAKIVDAAFNPTMSGINEMKTFADVPVSTVNDVGNATVQGLHNTAEVSQAGQTYRDSQKTYDFGDQFEKIFANHMPPGMDMSTLDSEGAKKFTEGFVNDAKPLYDRLKAQYANDPEALSQLDTVFTAYINKLKDKSSSIKDRTSVQNAEREAISADNDAGLAAIKTQTEEDFMNNSIAAQKNMDLLKDPVKKKQWDDFKALAELDDSGITKRMDDSGNIVYDMDFIRDGNNRKMGDAGFDANSAEFKYDLMDEGTLKKMEQFFLENKMNESFYAAQQALNNKQNLMTEGGDIAYMETAITDEQNTNDLLQMLKDQGFTIDPSDTYAVQEMNKTMVPYLKGLGIPTEELDGFIKRGGLFSTDPNDLQYIKLISDGMAKKRSTDENYYKNLNDAAGRALNGTQTAEDLELLKEEAVFQHVNAVRNIVENTFGPDIFTQEGSVDLTGSGARGPNGVAALMSRTDISGRVGTALMGEVTKVLKGLNGDLINIMRMDDSDAKLLGHFIQTPHRNDTSDFNAANYPNLVAMDNYDPNNPPQDYRTRFGAAADEINRITTMMFKGPVMTDLIRNGQLDAARMTLPQSSINENANMAHRERMWDKANLTIEGEIAAIQKPNPAGGGMSSPILDIGDMADIQGGYIDPKDPRAGEKARKTYDMITRIKQLTDPSNPMGLQPNEVRTLQAYEAQLRMNLFDHLYDRMVDDMNAGTFKVPTNSAGKPISKRWANIQNIPLNKRMSMLKRLRASAKHSKLQGVRPGFSKDVGREYSRNMIDPKTGSIRGNYSTIYALIDQYMT